MMLGQEPRQTTSNLGHLHKPSIQALIHGLNRHYYSIAISYRCADAGCQAASFCSSQKLVSHQPGAPALFIHLHNELYMLQYQGSEAADASAQQHFCSTNQGGAKSPALIERAQMNLQTSAAGPPAAGFTTCHTATSSGAHDMKPYPLRNALTRAWSAQEE